MSYFFVYCVIYVGRNKAINRENEKIFPCPYHTTSKKINTNPIYAVRAARFDVTNTFLPKAGIRTSRGSVLKGKGPYCGIRYTSFT